MMFKRWFNNLFQRPSDPNTPAEVVAYRRAGLSTLLFLFSISAQMLWEHKEFEYLKKQSYKRPMLKPFPLVRLKDDIEYHHLTNSIVGSVAVHVALIGGYVAEQIAFDREIRTTPPVCITPSRTCLGLCYSSR